MEDIQVIDIIDNEETGGATVVVEVSREMLLEVFARWLNDGVQKYAEEVLSVFKPSTVSDEKGPAPEADQSSEELARNRAEHSNVADPDWSGSFTYPHER